MKNSRTILLVLALTAAAFCPPHEVKIIDGTWEGCTGGVLPDQVEVPSPVPMNEITYETINR